MTKKHTGTKHPGTPAPGAPEDALPEASAPATTDDLEFLKASAAKAAENWDRFLRASADLENYKKRAARERQDAELAAQARLLTRFIPVLDNFEMALAAAGTSSDPAAQSLLAGVQMIAQQFRSALTESGLEEIDANGKMFDPNLHEAVAQHDAADVPEGQVVQQLRKGYRLRERLLRPATVVVARRPAGTPDDSGASA